MRMLVALFLMLIFMSTSIAQAEKKILINLASRSLSLYDGNKRIGLYPLGVGKVSTPTPVGYYKILTKEVNPSWIDPSNPEYEIPSGASNPLGYRWMQIHGNYGIHGTNRPDSIGYYVSNGCIRMKEPDVEDLFDKVEVGTPVEITYNRVIVEKAPDDQIVYYIYPDGYGRQNLDVKYVNSWLIPWGVSAFADDNEISEAISKSNGQPIYVGKAYNLQLDDNIIPATDQNNRHFDNKAVEREGIIYLPAVPIAIAMDMKLEWRHHTTLATKYGEVSGIEKKGQLYINEDDAPILFKVEGWREGNDYKMKRISDQETFGKDNPEENPNNANGNTPENPEAEPSGNNQENNVGPTNESSENGNVENNVEVDKDAGSEDNPANDKESKEAGNESDNNESPNTEQVPKEGKKK